MGLVVSTVVFPAVFLALALGTGLLIERLAGWRIPGPLLLAVGFAGLVCVGQLCTSLTATAPLTPWIALGAALAGWIIGRGRAREFAAAIREHPWLPLATAAAYLMAIAPVVLAGRVTLAGYLVDTTSAIHIAGADWLLHHGRDFSQAGGSSYGLQVAAYFDGNYPSGGHVVLGLVGRLVPGDLLWEYQPFMAMLVAFSVGPLWFLLRRVGLGRVPAAIGAVVAAAPALVYGVDLVGAIKETSALPLLLALAALAALAPAWVTRGPRAVLPAALVAAAGLGAIGVPFGAWIGLAVLMLIPVALPALREGRLRWTRLLLMGITGAGIIVLGSIPTTSDLVGSVRVARGFTEPGSALAADSGNLLQPIHAAQVLGVWLNGQYRLDPSSDLLLTYTLIGVVLVSVVLGAIRLLRRADWPLVIWVAGVCVIWWILTSKGNVWTDYKLIVLSSPVALFLAWAGAGSLLGDGRRIDGILLGAVIAVGVLWSNALQYHETNLAPTGRFKELQAIARDHVPGAPVLLNDFDEYALYILRDHAPDLMGAAHKGPTPLGLVDDAPTGYGRSFDLDEISEATFAAHPVLVVRRSPEASRPPSAYRLVHRGRWYDVWQRPADAALNPRLSLQGTDRADAKVACRRVRALARRDPAGTLVAAARPRTIVIDPRRSWHSPGWLPADDGLWLATPGLMRTTFTTTRPGRWRMWLKGDIARPLTATIDGRRIGKVGWQSGGDGNYLAPLEVELSAGRHRLRLVRGGGGVEPGNASFSRLRRVILEPANATGAGTLIRVPTSRAEALCGRRLDWVELSSAR